MELIDEVGFADTGVSGNEHQFWPTTGDDAVERGQQTVDLGCTPVQLLGRQQPVRRVVFAKGKFSDAALGSLISARQRRRSLDAGGCLVAVLTVLRREAS